MFDKNRRPFDKNKKNDNRESSNKFEKNVVVKDSKPEKAQVKEEVKQEKKATVEEDYSIKTVSELRNLAKAKEVKGYSTMKKAELIEALNK